MLFIVAHAPITTHEARHFFDALQWERRGAQWLHCNGHQFHRVIICRYSIGAEFSTTAAPVNNRPFISLAYPHGNRLHMPAAIGSSVAWFLINMQAAQTIRAMISVTGSGVFRGHQPPTYLAHKAIVAGMGFIISFLVQFFLIFSVQGIVLLKVIIHTFGEVWSVLRKPPG